VTGYDAKLDEDVSYDPERARELLEEVGQTDLRFTGSTPDIEPYVGMMEVFQAQLEDIGVELSVEVVPGAESFAAIARTDFQTNNLIVGPTAANAANTYLSKSSGTSPEEFTEMVLAANALDQDGAEAEAAYEEMTDYLVTSPYNMMVCRAESMVLSRTDVVGADELPFNLVTLAYDPSGLGVVGP